MCGKLLVRQRHNIVPESDGRVLDCEKYSRSHAQQGGGEPEGLAGVGLSPLIFVLSLLANATPA
jgi:hypothetical protein